MEPSLRRLASDPLGVLQELAPRAREEGIVQLAAGLQPVFVVGDPGLVTEVLVSRADRFVKQNVIDTSGGESDARDPADDTRSHATARRIVAPAFSRETAEAHVAVVARALDELCERLAAGGERRVLDDLRMLASRVVAEAVLGRAPDDAHRLASATERFLATFRFVASPARLVVDGLRLRLPPAAPAYRTLQGFVDATVTHAGSGEPSVPGLLAHAGVDGAVARRRALGVFVAGVETTASALSWALLHLAHEPRLQEALRSEADGVLGDGTPTAEAADALPLARAVLTETLRLYPPSWFIARRSLVEQELAGIGLPAGAIVVVPPLTLHRDPRFFPRPDDFDAGRWLGGGPGPDAERSFLPFGLGTRRCLGERLAWLEGVLGVAVITQRCRLETVAPLPPPLPRSVLAPADGARLRVLARHRGLM